MRGGDQEEEEDGEEEWGGQGRGEERDDEEEEVEVEEEEKGKQKEISKKKESWFLVVETKKGQITIAGFSTFRPLPAEITERHLAKMCVCVCGGVMDRECAHTLSNIGREGAHK